MGGLKAFSLNRGIRNKPKKHLIPGSREGIWYLAATQSAKDWRLLCVSIKHFQVIICTFLMLLNLKLTEGLFKKKETFH